MLIQNNIVDLKSAISSLKVLSKSLDLPGYVQPFM
jgi:hypothetical protein